MNQRRLNKIIGDLEGLVEYYRLTNTNDALKEVPLTLKEMLEIAKMAKARKNQTIAEQKTIRGGLGLETRSPCS